MATNVNNKEVTDGGGAAVQTTSLTQLQISSTPIGFVKYGDFLVQLYGKANQCTPSGSNQQNRELFYHSPLSLLDVSSIQTKYNRFSNQHQVTFNVEMWNEEIHISAMEKIKEILPNSIPSQVQILPYEKVWLTSSVNTNDCKLDTEPPACGNLPKSIAFKLKCSSQEKAEEVANNMRESPEDFAESLRLFIHLSSIETKKSQTQVIVDIGNTAKLSSQLLQKFSLDVSHALMSDDATQRMLGELTNISVQTYDEIGEAGNQERGFDAYQILKEMLVDGREMVKRGDVAWESVFWVDENSRPDRVCRQVNDLEKSLSSEEWDKITTDFQKERETKKTEGSGVNTKRLVELQEESQNLREENVKTNRKEDGSEKNQTLHKSIDETKRNVGGNIAIEPLKFIEVGKIGASYGREKNQNQEDGNAVEKTSIRHDSDSSAHHDENKLKESVKVDEADSFGALSSNTNKDLDSSSEGIEIARKRLEDNKNHIEWDGDKFVPKEMQLNRINLTKIRSRQVFEDLRIRASRIVTSICLPVKILPKRNLELDIAVKHSEIRILEEEKTAKEEEIDTQNRIILEMEKEILNLQREKQADIDAKISEILEKEIEIENLKREIDSKHIEIHDFFAEMFRLVMTITSGNPTAENIDPLLRKIFLKIIFRFYDKDGNGFISATEFRHAKAHIAEMFGKNKPTDQDLEEAVKDFFKADIDGDGQVSYQEFDKVFQNEQTTKE